MKTMGLKRYSEYRFNSWYMQADMKKHLEEFLEICYSRLEIQGSEDRNYFRSKELLNEIIEELADVSNYAFLEYVKIRELQAKMKSTKHTTNLND
jgi:hypothetical protein